MPKFTETVKDRNVHPGVYSLPVDTSLAETITTVGGMAIQANRDRVEGSLEAGIDAAVQDTLNAPMEANQAQAAMEQSVAEEAGVVGGGDLSLAYTDDAAQIYAKKFAKLEAMRVQGADLGLSLRVQALVKEAKTSLPGLSSEWDAVASRTMGTYKYTLGMLQANEKLRMKNAIDLEKQKRNYAIEAGVSELKVLSGYLETPEGLQELKQRSDVYEKLQQKKRAWDVLEVEGKTSGHWKGIAEQAAGDRFSAELNHTLLNFDNSFMSYLNTTLSDKAKMALGGQALTDMAQLHNAAPDVQSELERSYNTFTQVSMSSMRQTAHGRLINDNAIWTSAESKVKSGKESFMRLISGKASAERYSAQQTVNNALVASSVPFNVQVLKKSIAGIRLSPSMEADVSALLWPSISRAMSSKVPIMTANSTEAGQVNRVAAQGWAAVIDNPDISSREGILNLTAANEDFANANAKDIIGLAEVWGDPKALEVLRASDAAEAAQAAKGIDKFATKTMNTALQQLQALPKEERGKVDIVFDTKAGTIRFAPKPAGVPALNEKVARKWNATYSKHLNNTIRAYSHAHGSDNYGKYLEQMVGAGVFSDTATSIKEAKTTGLKGMTLTELLGKAVSAGYEATVAAATIPVGATVEALQAALEAHPDFQKDK